MRKFFAVLFGGAAFAGSVYGADVELKTKYSASSSHEKYPIEVFNTRNGVGYWLDGTKTSGPDWVLAKLDGPQVINKVVVESKNKDYDVFIFDLEKKCWLSVKNTMTTLNKEDIYTFAPVKTDAVRLHIKIGVDEKNYANLSKFKIYKTDAADAENFAAGVNTDVPILIAGYEASSCHPNRPLETFPVASWIDGTPGVFPDYLTVVFDGKMYFNQVVLRYVPDGPPEKMEIQVKVNNEWQTVAKTDQDDLEKTEFNFPAVETDAVRLVIEKSAKPYKYSSIAKFEIWYKK